MFFRRSILYYIKCAQIQVLRSRKNAAYFALVDAKNGPALIYKNTFVTL